MLTTVPPVYMCSHPAVLNRLYVAWPNDASLEFGGRLVDPLSWKYSKSQFGFRAAFQPSLTRNHSRDRQAYEYFSEKEWIPGCLTAEYMDSLDEVPLSEWRVLLGYRDSRIRGMPPLHDDDWMEFTNRWSRYNVSQSRHAPASVLSDLRTYWISRN